MFTRDDIIHGDRFVELADYAVEQNDSVVDESQLHKDGLIFVKTDRIPEFFQIVKDLPYRYVIISHNSDHNITTELYDKKPANVLHWFAQNVLIRRHDLTCIPIGIERPCVSGMDTVGVILEALKEEIEPDNVAYLNFAWETNPGYRQPIIETYKDKKWVTVERGRIPLQEYLRNIKRHVFTFCPPGNGWDTHRLWETLYMGGIPIAELTPNGIGYFSNQWVERGRNTTLLKLFESLENYYPDKKKLKMRYWIDQIVEKKHDLLPAD